MKENTSQEKKTARRGRIAGQNMKKDSSTTLLFKTSNENFAELFNRTMSDFDQLRPEDLSEEDIKEAAYLRLQRLTAEPLLSSTGMWSKASETAVNALAELTHSPQLQRILTPQYRTKKGGFNVCKGLDGMIQEGIQKGMKKGMEKGILTGKKEMAVSLSAMGMSVEEIAKAAKVREGVVRSWLSGNAG